MFALLQSEWYKLRKSKILSLVFVGPFIGLFLGLNVNFGSDPEVNEWYVSLLYMNVTYALLFLPLITGVFASTICRYEHQAGGWKQLLSLPVSRVNVFVVKFILLMLIVFMIQLLYLGAIYVVGMLKGYTDPFPMTIVWKSIFGGWIAAFPLVALQLWMSIVFKSFAAPLAVNVIFTLPSILAANSERFGPYYPWAQPFQMMYIGNPNDVFFVPLDQLFIVVGGSFLLFFFGGLFYFQRKMI